LIPDAEGIRFLQWCLPRLGLRWPGFRKVRRQVFKRINQRMQELELFNVADYWHYVEAHPQELLVLDTLCWIGISRFYRDRGTYEDLQKSVLPQLAQMLVARGDEQISCWSAGCAGGEEPYTLVILWNEILKPKFPTLALRIVATDVDPLAIQRAERGCYRASSAKELPAAWRERAFTQVADGLCLKDEYRSPITFIVQDIRKKLPDGPFHLILCRNLVFTYFDEAMQRKTMQRITAELAPGGVLVLGKLESLPEGHGALMPWFPSLGVYRKIPNKGYP